MKIEKYMTLKEIEETYDVKAKTVRTYLIRDQVVPAEKRMKIGHMWLIDRDFAKEKWGKKNN